MNVGMRAVSLMLPLNSPSLFTSVLPHGAAALREAEEAEGRAGES